jgi:hypothetical protein
VLLTVRAMRIPGSRLDQGPQQWRMNQGPRRTPTPCTENGKPIEESTLPAGGESTGRWRRRTERTHLAAAPNPSPSEKRHGTESQREENSIGTWRRRDPARGIEELGTLRRASENDKNTPRAARPNPSAAGRENRTRKSSTRTAAARNPCARRGKTQRRRGSGEEGWCEP